MGEFDEGNKRRDERLRRRILDVLHLARGYAPEGGLSGVSLLDRVESALPDDQRFDGDAHFLSLCRDLVNLELAAMKSFPLRRGERFAPRHGFYTITAKGSQLVEERIPAIAGVYDERMS